METRAKQKKNDGSYQLNSQTGQKFRDPSDIYFREQQMKNQHNTAQGKTPRQTISQDAQLRNQQQLLAQRVQQASQLPQMYGGQQVPSNKSSFNRYGELSKGPITRQIHLKQLEKAQQLEQQQQLQDNHMNTDRNHLAVPNDHEDLQLNGLKKPRNSVSNADRLAAALVGQNKLMLSGEDDEETAVNFASERNHYAPAQQPPVGAPAGPRSGVIQNQYVQQHQPIMSSDESDGDDEIEREGLTATASVKAMESEVLVSNQFQSKFQQSDSQTNGAEYRSNSNAKQHQNSYIESDTSDVYGQNSNLKGMNVPVATRERNQHRQQNSWTRQPAPYNHKRAVSDNLYRSANHSGSAAKDQRQNASPMSTSKLTTTQKVLRKGLGLSESNRDISPFSKAARAQEEHFKKQSELIQKRSQKAYAPMSYNAAQNYRSDAKHSSSATRLRKSSSKSKKISTDQKQSSNGNFEYVYNSTVRTNRRAGIFSYDVIDEEQSNEAKESMVSKQNTDTRRVTTYNSHKEQVEQVAAAAKNVISSEYGNDVSETQTSDIVEQDDEFEIPQSPERTKRNNLRQINDNIAMNRGTIKKSDSKSFANNNRALGISVSTLKGSGMTAPNRQAQSFMSRDSRQYQTINATGQSSHQMGYNYSKSFVGAQSSSQQSKADLSQRTNTLGSRMVDKFRTIAPTDTTSFKRIATDTLGSIDDEPRPMKTGVVYRNEGPSDSSSVKTLRSYQANNGAVIGQSHPASASSKRIQQPYARPLKEQLSPNMSQRNNKYSSNVTPSLDRYQKMIGSSQQKQVQERGFGTHRDTEPTLSNQDVSKKVFMPRNSPLREQSRHNGESEKPLSVVENFKIVDNNFYDQPASEGVKHVSLAEASLRAKIVQGSSPLQRGNHSSNASPQARRFQGTDEAAGKGISLITVTKIPQEQNMFTAEYDLKTTQRTSMVAVTPQLKNLDEVNRRQNKMQRVLGLNPQSKPQALENDYLPDQRANLEPLTPQQEADPALRTAFIPTMAPSTTRHQSDDRIASGLQSTGSASLRYGAHPQQSRPRVNNPSVVGLDSNRIQINLYNFEQERTITGNSARGTIHQDRSQITLDALRPGSQASAVHAERMATGESSNTADIEAKIEQFGLEQFRLGQLKLEQELQQKETKIQEDYDSKLQKLQNQIQKEQTEKAKLAEEAERRAQEQAQEIKDQLRNELEAEMREKMRQLDEQHQRENESLKEQIATIKGSYLDMQTNLMRNEQIRKVQQQQIIHLKGNMRVFARVKPNKTAAPEMQQAVGEDEGVALGGVNIFDHAQFEPSLLTFPQLMEDAGGKVVKVAHQSLELHMPRVGGGTQATQVFNFDHVFLPKAGQADLFEEIKPFVQTALDGENTCIFAYGQTGSGKTYTMEGPSTPGEDGPTLFDQATMKPYTFSGILPRIAIFIQHEIDRYRRQFHQEIFIEVSALEIYCDHIRDLLGQSIDPNKQRYVEIRNAGNNKVQCLGQTWVRVSSPAEFLLQISESAKKRVFRDNGINPHSSRSHHVFQIRVNSYDKLGKPCQSMLNVVDLAGSERRVGTLNVFSSQHDDEYYSTTTGNRNKKKRGSKAPSKKDSAAVQNRFQLDYKRPSGISANSNISATPPQSQNSTQQRAVASIIQDQQGAQSFNSKFVSTNPSSLGKTEKTKRASVFTTHKKSFMSGNGQTTLQKAGAGSSRQLQLQGPENLRHSVSQQTMKVPTTGAATQSLLEQIPKTYDLETESKFINKNLTTLGRVLAILANRKLQGKMAPPYRECKLTRLLQSSLQHDKCKTLMIVNVCISMKNATATKESLEFASKAMTAF